MPRLGRQVRYLVLGFGTHVEHDHIAEAVGHSWYATDPEGLAYRVAADGRHRPALECFALLGALSQETRRITRCRSAAFDIHRLAWHSLKPR